VTSGGNNLNSSPDHHHASYCLMPGFYSPHLPPPLNFYEAPRFVPPIERTPLQGRTLLTMAEGNCISYYTRDR